MPLLVGEVSVMESNDFENKTYYELLGVSRTASAQEIREAYKEIARIYHPDSNYYGDMLEYGLSERDNRLFQLITAAYDTLIKPDKRQKYDDSLPPELKGWDDGGTAQPTDSQIRMRAWSAPNDAETVDNIRRQKLRQSSSFGSVPTFENSKHASNFATQGSFAREAVFRANDSQERMEKLERSQLIVGILTALTVAGIVLLLLL